MAYHRLTDLRLIKEYCCKQENAKCPIHNTCYDDEFQCRYWKQIFKRFGANDFTVRQGSHWYKAKGECMTSKDLSRELCEICGIERKGKLIFRKRDWDGRSWILAGRGYKEFDFETIPEVTVDIIPTKDYKETNGFQYPYTDIEKIKKIYNEHGYDFVEFRQNVIDFTSPENFVRLLKIANDVLGGVHFATAYTKNKPHIFEEQALMHYMPIAKLNNAFQIAIRETEWVYE